MRLALRHRFLLLISLAIPYATRGQTDWPEFRGPTGQGHATSTRLPLRWSATDAETFVNDVPLGGYFEKAVTGAKNPKAVANWVINNLRAKIAEAGTTLDAVKIKPSDIRELIALVDGGKISGSIAQGVFAEMFASGEAPGKIVEQKGLAQVSDTGAIEKFCDDVIAANPKSAEDFRAGKTAALNFLKGQVMKASQGKANPALVGEILERKLKG